MVRGAPLGPLIAAAASSSTYPLTSTELWSTPLAVNAQELKKWLAAQGCTFETKKGGSGHLVVRRGDRKTELPMHGGRRELGTGLVNAIKKQLGLK